MSALRTYGKLSGFGWFSLPGFCTYGTLFGLAGFIAGILYLRHVAWFSCVHYRDFVPTAQKPHTIDLKAIESLQGYLYLRHMNTGHSASHFYRGF